MPTLKTLPEPLLAACAITAPPRPASLAALFWAISGIALQGFGGVLAVVQRELVEKKQWLTIEEFVEDWAASQIMPGPNVVNLALIIGDRYFGWRGALAALAGMLTFPLLVVMALTIGLAGIGHLPAVQGALRGMGAVSAGLIAAVGIKLVAALKNNPMGQLTSLAIGGLAFVAIALFRLPLAWVLLSLGPLASVWASHCLVQRGEA
jgi:chromate transporter